MFDVFLGLQYGQKSAVLRRIRGQLKVDWMEFAEIRDADAADFARAALAVAPAHACDVGRKECRRIEKRSL